MLVSSQVREIAEQIEELTESSSQKEQLFKSLVTEVSRASLVPDIKDRYQHYNQFEPSLGQYPIDDDGYAKSFDPITQEAEFFDCWLQHGIVVGKAVVSTELCQATIERLCEITGELSDGACDLFNPATYSKVPVDAQGTPLISRGFFEIYHDKSIADIRQLVRLYLHHAIIWGQANLWSSFDRFGIKLPETDDAKGLPLHVDQNPLQHPDFRTIQGVLALADCPVERGSFVGVPGSRSMFNRYETMAGRGEYVELVQDGVAESLRDHAQVLPLRAGDIVSWDSRTTHCNSSNTSNLLRFVAYIAAGPVPADEKKAFLPRAEALRTGLGSNVRDSLMHASMRPRFTDEEAISRVRRPEDLHLLGEMLYGTRSYSDLT